MFVVSRSIALAMTTGALWAATSTLALAACKDPTARIVAVSQSVQVREAGSAAFTPAALNAPVCQGDVIRVGPSSRTTVAFLESGLRLTVEQNTEWVVRQPRQPGRSLIQLIRGAILFITRQPRSLDVETPFVNAAVEGTEFVVRVEGASTSVAVLEGTVRLSNDHGDLTLTTGHAGLANAGQAPKPISVRPRDAVQWALHYEPLFADDSLESLENVPSSERDARFYVRRASVRLGVGGIEDARRDLETARRLDAKDGTAFALSAIIDVALNDRQSALENGQRAVALSPDSIAAHLALSYAYQAAFNLEGARNEILRVVPANAADDRPEHALALARLAELSLSLSDYSKALAAAHRATAVAPSLGRTQVVMGFAALSVVDITGAKAAFQKAIEVGSDDPLAHLGLGLAQVRAGDLHGGRAEIETAAALSAVNPIVRSYLGKAYFDERRESLAGEQFALAKDLDPLDPTAFLYDAVLKQTTNRPVEALQDLQKSISLNDNRAVYRSRLLLDSDLAARSASLGRIYRDLGFEQLAAVTGWRSVEADPGDYSGHRLLSDIYSALPRHEIARVSELLQSQLLQPLNISPVPPSLAETDLFILERAGPSEPAFNEFNPLFNRNRLALLATGTVGAESILGDEVAVSGVWNRASFSIGQYHYDADGFRDNNQQDRDLFNAFVQLQLSRSTSAQLEFRAEDVDAGDLVINFDPTDFSPEQANHADGNTVRFGLKHVFNPNSLTIVSVYSRNRDETFAETLTEGGFVTDVDALNETDSWTAEARHFLRVRQVNLTGGIGYFGGDRHRLETQAITDPASGETLAFPPDELHEKLEQTNLYAYATSGLPGHTSLTLGASADFYRREALEINQFNPKIGFTWNPFRGTTVRAAAFRTLNRPLVSGQTIEPTEVAGFNQLFADREGDDTRRYGAALDQQFSTTLTSGVELTRRNLRIPVEFADDPGTILVQHGSERSARAYLYWTPTQRASMTAEYFYEHFERDPAATVEEAFLSVRTHRFPFGVRYFSPSGFSARLNATAIKQRGVFFIRGIPADGRDSFWVVDGALKYRLPRRYGSVLLEVRNLFDEKFLFQDTDPGNPTIRSGRLAVLRFVVGM